MGTQAWCPSPKVIKARAGQSDPGAWNFNHHHILPLQKKPQSSKALSGRRWCRLYNTGWGCGDIPNRGIFSEGSVSEQNQKRSCGEGSLLFILNTVDRVWGALRPAVPRQDVFEVAGLEFYVLKKIRGVLSHVSCRKRGSSVRRWARGPCLQPPNKPSDEGSYSPETLQRTITALLHFFFYSLLSYFYCCYYYL